MFLGCLPLSQWTVKVSNRSFQQQMYIILVVTIPRPRYALLFEWTFWNVFPLLCWWYLDEGGLGCPFVLQVLYIFVSLHGCTKSSKCAEHIHQTLFPQMFAEATHPENERREPQNQKCAKINQHACVSYGSWWHMFRFSRDVMYIWKIYMLLA